jgi:hypothetical protein
MYGKPADEGRHAMTLIELKNLNKTLLPELEALFARHDLKMGKTSSLNDALGGSIKFTITVQDTKAVGSDGKPASPYRRDWLALAKYTDGIDPDWLDRVFEASGGKTYTITGLKVGRGDPKVVCESGGKAWLFPCESVSLRMRMAAPAAR